MLILVNFLTYCEPPFLFGRMFRGAGHEKKREEQLWSLAFRPYTGSFPCAELPGTVHTARLGQVCFSVYILSRFVLFDLFVCLHYFIFSWAVESSPLQFLALA